MLITLTVREYNAEAHLVAGGREQENLHLLRRGGADDEVVEATAAVGRMLGLATYTPAAVQVLNDFIDAGTGLELIETGPAPDGSVPANCTLVGVIRDGERLAPVDTDPTRLEARDRLIVVRESTS